MAILPRVVRVTLSASEVEEDMVVGGWRVGGWEG